MQDNFEYFESRFSGDVPAKVRQDVWNGYWKLLVRTGIELVIKRI